MHPDKIANFNDAFKYLAVLDSNFQLILDLYGTPNIPSRPEGFETLCKIILEQQVSLDSAKATFDRLKTAAPDFSPFQILSLAPDSLRAAGLSRQKAGYLQNLASDIQSGKLDLNFAGQTSEDIRRQLTSVKGIGNWTADVYMMFALQLTDLMPISDIGIIVTLREIWGIETLPEMTDLTIKWSPHRTAASYFLWHYYLKKRGRVIHM